MTDVNVSNVTAEITFEPEVIVASPEARAAALEFQRDIARVRELLRPIIIEIIEDEFATYQRSRG